MTELEKAARLALEALEYLATQIKPDYEHDKAITALRRAIEQPAVSIESDVRDLAKWLNEEQTRPINRVALARVLAFVQQPAAFVGLTNEEMEKISVENGKATFLNDDEETDILWFDGDCFALLKAAEAKLREKNTPEQKGSV
jgi:hypothetical protein